jgi:CubicO group peptidase (beta-lactamase class C family)
MLRTYLLSAPLLSLALAAQQAASPFLPDRIGRVESLLRSVVEQGQHAGVSCLVLHRGKEVLAHTFGVADIGTGAPLQRSAIVRIYSMSKPITAVTALCLVERGVLRLDQPIKDLLPEFNKPEVFEGGTAEGPLTVMANRSITVRMLLNHTAGFSYDFFRSSPVHEIS